MPRRDAEPEWRVHRETIYVAGYIFYGRVPPLPPGGEEAEWGRGRRPEDEGPAVWVEVVVFLSVIGTYLLCVLPDYLAATTEHATTALALLPTCRPLAHGPPMCYEWERPTMAPPPGSGPDGVWSHHDDEKAASAMEECFSTGLVRGTALALLPTCLPLANAPPMCYEWERPATAPPPGSGSRDSGWSDSDDDMECFYGLVRDATRTSCYEWERNTMAPPGSGSGDSDWSGNDNKATMECFYAVVRNAVKTYFGWSYGTIHPDGHGNGDPPSTRPKTENVLMASWRNWSR